MGLGGILVRKVFFKNRASDGTRDANERHFGFDKSKWSTVKHYFCGDEFNSLLAEDDFASLRSTEAAMVQSIVEECSGEEVSTLSQIEEPREQISEEEEESMTTNSSCQEKAAITIQSAFRGFRARLQYEATKLLDKADDSADAEQKSEVTEALSTIVQVGDFAEAQESQEEVFSVSPHVPRKAGSQMCRIKEEWDDSTVSSKVLKLRIQNRLEAMTRRERALAYAFSQQLRTCSKKKSSKCDTTDPGMGWSWLERWMATRLPENSLADDCLSRHLEPIFNYQKPIIIRKRFDVAFEEKESCGSNDVPVSSDGSTGGSQVQTTGYSQVKNMLKATESVTRRKILPEYHQKSKGTKACKGDASMETEKEKRCKQVQPKSIGDTKFKDAS